MASLKDVLSLSTVPLRSSLPWQHQLVNRAWQGLFAPAATPRPVVDRIAAEVKRIWELPDVVAALKNGGAEPAPSTPDEFTEYTRAERARWGAVVKASGVQID